MSGRHFVTVQVRAASKCVARAPVRGFSAAYTRRQTPSSTTEQDASAKEDEKDANTSKDQKEESAMSRRLSQMTEDAMLEGGQSARRNMEQAGFSEELKKQLEERMAAASFKSEHAAAHSILDMPASAGAGTRDIAGSTAWTGSESLHDSALRMLDDASKPIRAPYKIPQPVNLQPAPKAKRTPGRRLADAKERTSTYTLSQAPGFSQEERESLRQEMKEKLTPGAHSVPISIHGLSSLANERIEDAIARGQFRKIKRGKGVNTETDRNANSAFIDTTEYFMNKIIQKQEIVPPWIEKQQELAMELSRFRQRLRSEWRRHAARLIASKGGSLEAQMRRAMGYAAAEVRLAEQAKLKKSLSEDVTEATAEPNKDGSSVSTDEAGESSVGRASPDEIAHLPPLRDPDYLAIERSYHELAVEHLNKLTRSYNLQAPRSAQKPYISLERELKSCYADIAPQLAEEIKRRSTERTTSSTLPARPASSSAAGSFSLGQTSPVADEDQGNNYGMKEFWRDLFSK
ncbi:hypothetical protein N7474_009260 [Penicillium riverlandense]|uniref:uncharacterized protein n=1 Tax=Penicillium riverlandense TaxID=1903569 RepID=UPI002546BA55|nr:uncharacterized protein N7474_009260 [Penicillium riverlandense]KAJ5807991.1 hypothetical protein N7474_009260 [Penicillium riverlandense]